MIHKTYLLASSLQKKFANKVHYISIINEKSLVMRVRVVIFFRLKRRSQNAKDEREDFFLPKDVVKISGLKQGMEKK